MMYMGMAFFKIILFGSMVFLEFRLISFTRFGNFQALFPQINFLPPFLSSSGTLMSIVMFDGVTEFPKSVLMFRNSFVQLIFCYFVFYITYSFLCFF